MSLDPSAAEETASSVDDNNDQSKVLVEFRNAGDARRLAKNIVRINRNKRVLDLYNYLIAKLSIPKEETLYLFVSTAFKPALDEEIGDLYDCFAVRNMLTIFYCGKEAWG
jgi:ubiquitin-like protein ATG12